MPSQKHEGSAHWSTDFVEHLRTVHFSLVILCLGLIIITSSTQRDSVTRRAKTQIDQITSVVNKLDDDWFKSYCQQRKSAPHTVAVAVPRGAKAFDARQHTTIKTKAIIEWNDFTPGKDEYLTIADECAVLDDLPDTIENKHFVGARFDDRIFIMAQDEQSAGFNTPQKLEEFAHMWDVLNHDLQIVIPTSLDDRVRALDVPAAQPPDVPPAQPDPRGAPPPVARPYTFEDSPEPVAKVDLEIHISREVLGKIDAKNDEEFAKSLLAYSNLFSQPDYVRIVSFDTVPLDGFSYLVGLLPETARTSWKKGSFAESFAELNNITKDRQSAAFGVWQKALADELQRGTESFEAFGLKVPAEATTLWGTILVIGVQLYMLIHLMEFSHKLSVNDPGWEVAWVGVYRRKLARCLFIASVMPLPLIAIVVLGAKAVEIADTKAAVIRAWIILAAGLLTSIYISFLTAKHTPNSSHK